MQPMDQEYIEQHDIAQRYLHGKLTPEEAEAFEIYLMEHQEIIESLELQASLSNGLNSVEKRAGYRYKNWFKNNLYKPLKYTALAGIAAGTVFFVNQNMLVNHYDLNQPEEIQLVVLDAMRGETETEINEVVVNPTAGLVAFMLATDLIRSSAVDVEIKHSGHSGRSILNKQFHTDGQGNINIALDVSGINPGRLEFRLSYKDSEFAKYIVAVKFSST